MKKLYTEAEMTLNREAGENKGRLLTALWVRGTGPRGGKVSIGQPRYEALELLAIEGKAQVVFRFTSTGFHWGELEAVGIVIRFPKIKDKQRAVVAPKPRVMLPGDQTPPWEE